MIQIGLVTCSDVAMLSPSERPLLASLSKRGFQPSIVIWDDPEVKWREFDVLIIRSVWDYHKKIERFMDWIRFLKTCKVMVLNDPDLLLMNLHKSYLIDLEEKGVLISPTHLLRKGRALDGELGSIENWEKVVVKPAVSASAYQTQAFTADQYHECYNFLESQLKERDMLAQLFVPEVAAFGEVSMMFFNRKYSHSVLKVPKKGEFRVQSEYGGAVRNIEPPKIIVDSGRAILSKYEGHCLYARVDGVIRGDQFLLMELELIEPYLFFAQNESALEFFVEELWSMINEENNLKI